MTRILGELGFYNFKIVGSEAVWPGIITNYLVFIIFINYTYPKPSRTTSVAPTSRPQRADGSLRGGVTETAPVQTDTDCLGGRPHHSEGMCCNLSACACVACNVMPIGLLQSMCIACFVFCRLSLLLSESACCRLILCSSTGVQTGACVKYPRSVLHLARSEVTLLNW